MSILGSRSPVFIHKETPSGRNTTGSDFNFRDLIWAMENNHRRHQETVPPLVWIPSRQKPSSNRRSSISNPMALLERSVSGPEEPFLRSLYRKSWNDVDLKTQSTALFVDDDALDLDHTEIKPRLAVAIPILVLGRPKLVDITNLAPMHKRKRSAAKTAPLPALKKVATQTSQRTAEKKKLAFAEEGDVEPRMKPNSPARLKRKEIFATTAPLSWFPTISPPAAGEEKSAKSEAYRSPTLVPSDNHVLSSDSPRPSKPSKLSRRHMSDTISPLALRSPDTPKTPNTPKSPGTPSWKGLSRSINMIRRQSANLQQDQPQSQLHRHQKPQHQQHHRPTRQVLRKTRKPSRSTNDQENAPIIPPFSFEQHLVMV